ncbi:hypothetical protein [Trichlorobacter lovleyi]|uniref:hypothetical protein n=1 Tax=Trichlorobacter lovleyi TaxID=313985 RepID=UPI00247FC6DA|nr:hypothetical protein [Trichlorobacter lovleyi]
MQKAKTTKPKAVLSEKSDVKREALYAMAAPVPKSGKPRAAKALNVGQFCPTNVRRIGQKSANPEK